MKILVCMKQVPAGTKVDIDPETGAMKRLSGETRTNPYDLFALEAALQLREKVGGSVTVLTMGPPQADVALREALAMGCDDAILMSDRAFGGSDTYATAHVIAAGLKTLDYDLIITGRQAIDGDTAQVGPQIAEKLHLAQVSYVEEVVEAAEDHVVVKRQFEDGYHIVKVKTPCLLTAIAELAEPRYMSIGGVFDAYQKEIKVLGFEDLKDDLELDMIGLKGSPTNVFKSFTKEVKGAGTILNGLTPEEAVDAIVKKLEEKFII